MKNIPYLLVLSLFLPALALAQSRGGACNAPICHISTVIVVLILVGAFFLTLVESILEHGFFAGIVKHKGVQILSLYVLSIGALMALTIGAERLFGKNGAIAFLLITMIVVYALWWRLGNSQKPRDPDTENDR